MNKQRSKGNLVPLGNRGRCRECQPEPRYKFLSPDEIMNLTVHSDEIFSLKVFAAAYFIAMSEYTGSADSREAITLLRLCADEIARGHIIELR